LRENSLQHLTLKDRVFEIERAEISAIVPDPYWSKKYNPGGDTRLFWMLHIFAKDRVFDGMVWRPNIRHEGLHFPTRRWAEIVSQIVEWNSPWDESTGQPNGGFYVFGHEDISRAVLRFDDRDRTKFRVAWNGLCNVLWDDEYGRDVPFAVEAWATLADVRVHGSESDTELSLRARLGVHLETKDFVQNSIRFDGHSYDDGVKMAHAVFTPRDQ
jgi:hypothetical protein